MSIHLNTGDCVLINLPYTDETKDVKITNDKTKQGIGLIKYIGMIRGQHGLMNGIELLQPIPKGHDGSIDGHKYFDSSKGHGIHIPIHQIIRKVSVAELFKQLQDMTFHYQQATKFFASKIKDIASPSSSAFLNSNRLSVNTRLRNISDLSIGIISSRKSSDATASHQPILPIFPSFPRKTSTVTYSEAKAYRFDSQLKEYSDSESASSPETSSGPCYSNFEPVSEHDTILDFISLRNSPDPVITPYNTGNITPMITPMIAPMIVTSDHRLMHINTDLTPVDVHPKEATFNVTINGKDVDLLPLIVSRARADTKSAGLPDFQAQSSKSTLYTDALPPLGVSPYLTQSKSTPDMDALPPFGITPHLAQSQSTPFGVTLDCSAQTISKKHMKKKRLLSSIAQQSRRYKYRSRNKVYKTKNGNIQSKNANKKSKQWFVKK